MAQDNSNKRSRRSSKKTKRRNTQNNEQTGPTFTKKDRTNTLPKLGNDTMDRMPSNAPTMAIAPSDYEHIFHEGPVSPDTKREATPPPPRSPQPPTIPRLTVQAPHSPIYQPQHTIQAPISPPQPQVYPNVHAQDMEAYGQDPYAERQNTNTYPPEVLATPDGYTLLGHAPSPRRTPLPPHIVRASNQFSRAALARVARYLASRADPQLRY